WPRDWSSDVCSSDLDRQPALQRRQVHTRGRAHLADVSQMCPPSCVYLAALLSRLAIACANRVRSPSTGTFSGGMLTLNSCLRARSEERRVGKECRAR